MAIARPGYRAAHPAAASERLHRQRTLAEPVNWRRSVLSKRAPGTPALQPRLRLIQAARTMFDCEDTIETALDCVLEAARQEFGVRVVVVTPCRLLVDGGEFVWPTSATSRAPEPTNGSRHA
jgi:hypothetical protein